MWYKVRQILINNKMGGEERLQKIFFPCLQVNRAQQHKFSTTVYSNYNYQINSGFALLPKNRFQI